MSKKLINNQFSDKRSSSLVKIAFLCAFFVLSGAFATAQQQRRYVKQNPSGGDGSGSSWADASNNLQDMINKSDPGDEVWVAAGTYKPQWTAAGWDPVAPTYIIRRWEAEYIMNIQTPSLPTF
jgi:hypothetical protein